MGSDELYDLPFTGLEESVKQSYREGIMKLKEADDIGEQYSILKNLFESLEGSCPAPGGGIEWAREIIPVYRNLGKILIENFSGTKDFYLKDIVLSNKNLKDYLPVKEEKHYTHKEYLSVIITALNEWNEIKEVLSEQGEIPITQLREILDESTRLEIENEVLKNRINKLDDL